MHERVCVEAALALFEGKRVVHVKGFESGLDFADAETAAAAKSLLSRLEEFDIVVWEGSDLERDSYTAVLEHAPAALVAFKYKDDKLDEKWSRVSACVEVEDRSERLCVAALSTTRARCVLCLGGDDGVAQDASMCPPQVNFHLYECGRWTIPEHVLERPALARGLGRGAIITTESAFQSIDEAATSTRYFLASNNRLVIKRSILLPTAGLGLFTALPLLRGQRVCDYVGDELTTIEAMRLEDKSYLMRLGPQSYVDARKRLDVEKTAYTLVYARYINDPRNSRAHNVVFAKLPDEGRAVVRATRYIASGEELYVSYGRLYWAAASAKGFDPDVLSQSAVRNILAAARLQALLLPKDTGYT